MLEFIRWSFSTQPKSSSLRLQRVWREQITWSMSWFRLDQRSLSTNKNCSPMIYLIRPFEKLKWMDLQNFDQHSLTPKWTFLLKDPSILIYKLQFYHIKDQTLIFWEASQWRKHKSVGLLNTISEANSDKKRIQKTHESKSI